MAADEKQAISKAAFAKAANVSRARVSQWLASGRISGPALTGSGRHQRIIADIAFSQLKGRLDASQRPTNGRNTHLPDDRIALMAATTDEQMRLVLLQERTALAEIRRTQAARAMGESLSRRAVVEAVRTCAETMAARTLATAKNATELHAAALQGGVPAVLRMLRAFERKQRRKTADDFRKLADGFPVPEATDDDYEDKNDGQPLLQPDDGKSRDEALGAPKQTPQ